ncbi:MAG: sigma-70 family RNA polymerase sigma factor [Candidatus Woesearchaeota archaeon]
MEDDYAGGGRREYDQSSEGFLEDSVIKESMNESLKREPIFIYSMDVDKRKLLGSREKEAFMELDSRRRALVHEMKRFPDIYDTANRNGREKYIRKDMEEDKATIPHENLDGLIASFKSVCEEYNGSGRAKKLRNLRGRLDTLYASMVEQENYIIESNLRLSMKVASHQRKHTDPLLPDIIQEGNTGLMKAVWMFDYRRGFKFSTYALWWVYQSMKRYIDENKGTVKTPVYVSELKRKVKSARRQISAEDQEDIDTICEISGLEERQVRKAIGSIKTVSLEHQISENVTIGDSISSDERTDEYALNTERRDKLSGVISSVLTPNEEKIIRRRFGLSGNGDYDEQKTLQEIGEELGVSRERIRQIVERSLKKMRKKEGHSLEGLL